MTTRLLFFHNSAHPIISDRLDEYFSDAGLDVDVCWAVNDAFPASLDPYGAIYFSGSPAGPWEPQPWIIREIEVIRDAARRGVPMLGTCFGSQVLAYALCGENTVCRRDNYEVGFVPLFATPALADDPIGHGLPSSFPVFSWHQDEVVDSHPDMILLARSELCSNHIWRHRTHLAWGMQGHPEAGGCHGRAWFEHYVHCLKSNGLPASLVPATDAAAVKTPDAMMLYDNFVRFVL